MNIGFIGLGKLGLPVALAIDNARHKVYGYDTNPAVATYLRDRKIPYHEKDSDIYLKHHTINFVETVAGVVTHADIIFIAVQSPHDKRFEGITNLPDERVNFDYTHLRAAVDQVCVALTRFNKVKHEAKRRVTMVIISTVLPATIDEQIRPLLTEDIDLVYNPFFIAMGTTIDDFFNPEFVLMGIDQLGANASDTALKMKKFYKTIHNRPVIDMPIREAEMTKVCYNTYISMKIAFANTVMELSYYLGVNSDTVLNTLGQANKRLMSDKYLSGGMGDGGGCHPRDNIAMSYLARREKISHDFFHDLMVCRQDQSYFFVKLIAEQKKKYPELRVVLLGASFKPETNLTVGSPALLLSHQLNKTGIAHTIVDPYVEEYSKVSLDEMIDHDPSIYFISTKHSVFEEMQFPAGSVVIDPHRYINPFDSQTDINYIPIG